MALLATLLLGLLVLLPAQHCYRIYRNYAEVRKTGLPIVVMPLSPINPLWFLGSNWAHRQLSRIGLGRLLARTHFGWETRQKYRPFTKHSAVIQVSPADNWVSVADPGALIHIYQGERKGDFERPPASIKMLDVFGPNISSASGANWQRMRRITAASFNESSSRVVWRETLRQGRAAVAHWLAAGAGGVRSTADDTRTLAMNVILRAGFGQQYDFEPSTKNKKSTKAGAMDYREALGLVLENAVLIIGIGTKMLPVLGSVSAKLGELATAVATFQRYMVDTLKQGREGSGGGSNNLLESLVRASRDDGQLTEDEVFGNMFVYTFGGHDTTAHSLAFTFVLLSIHPEVQAWMREELRGVLKGDDPESWSYDEFGKLKRTLAVQYETMRLYNPLLGLVKSIPEGRTQQLPLENGKRTITLAGPINIVVNLNALHSDPRYWGDDSLEWRPQRWIHTDADGVEQLLVPERGRYLAWSDGMRACPGKKFGQVEHVAVMAAAFRDHGVEAAREPGEGPEETRRRIEGVIADNGMVLNFQMFHPENARLVWKKAS